MQMIVYVGESVRRLKTETVSSPMQYKIGTVLYSNLNSQLSGLEFFMKRSGVLSVLRKVQGFVRFQSGYMNNSSSLYS